MLDVSAFFDKLNSGDPPGFGARIALDSGKRFDSASRYIEDRGDEPMAARKFSRVTRKYKTKVSRDQLAGVRGMTLPLDSK